MHNLLRKLYKVTGYIKYSISYKRISLKDLLVYTKSCIRATQKKLTDFASFVRYLTALINFYIEI